MPTSHPIKDPTAFVPLGISLFCLALILGHVAIYGLVRGTDEGLAARTFQLLMLAQLPIVAVFGMKWIPRSPRQGFTVLALQVTAFAATIAILLVLEHFSRPV